MYSVCAIDAVRRRMHLLPMCGPAPHAAPGGQSLADCITCADQWWLAGSAAIPIWTSININICLHTHTHTHTHTHRYTDIQIYRLIII